MALQRAGTMAITVEEGKRFLAKDDIPKLARAGTMAQTIDEARRILAIDALWKPVTKEEKETAPEPAAAAAEDDEEAPKGKGKKGKKASPKKTPKRQSVKAKKGAKAVAAEAAEAHVEASDAAREAAVEAARNRDRSNKGVDEAWKAAEKHKVSVLYLTQERTAEFDVTAKTTLLELFGMLETEFAVERDSQRLVVHSPKDGSFKQIDGKDVPFHAKTLPELGILPSDQLHLMKAMFVIAEGATTATRVVDSVTADVWWGYLPGVFRDYLDATCMAFSKDGKRLGHVDWRDKKCDALKFLTHSGNLMNDAARQGHDRINVDLKAVPEEVGTLFFLASAWNALHVSDLVDPSVSVIDDKTAAELCPPHVKEFGTKFRCLILLALTRSSTENAWDVIALGKGSDGCSRDYTPIVKTLVDVCLPIVSAGRHTVEESAPKP